MEHRTLEITLQSGRDLNKVNLISKMDVYAVVSISGGDKTSKQKTRSPVDHDGDSNPTWNFTMNFTVDEASLQANRLTLDFKLVCERALGDKDVGEVSVPIKELLDSADGKKFLSYQVRKPSGKPKGQLTFSCKFTDKITAAAKTDFTGYPAGASSGYPPAGAYPPPSGYPAVEGGGHYPPPVAYPAAEGGGQYPPPQPAYPAVAEGSGQYPPPQPAYPAVAEGSGQYPPPQPAYPAVAGGSGNYPPPAPAPAGYPVVGDAHKQGGYPPPPPAGYGYPAPPPPGYGYPAPPPPGYGYPPQQGYGYPPVAAQQQKKKNKFGLGLGAGLLGGAIGGMLIGDAISDVGDFDGGFDGGFDF